MAPNDNFPLINENTFIVPRLEDYDISPLTGFLAASRLRNPTKKEIKNVKLNVFFNRKLQRFFLKLTRQFQDSGIIPI